MKNLTFENFKAIATESEDIFEYVALCTSCGNFMPFVMESSIEIQYPANHPMKDKFKFMHYSFKPPVTISCSCEDSKGVLEVPKDLVLPVKVLLDNKLCIRAIDLNRVVYYNLIIGRNMPADYRIIPNCMLFEVVGKDRADKIFTALKNLIKSFGLDHIDASNTRILNYKEEIAMDDLPSDDDFESLNTPDGEQLFLINIYNKHIEHRTYEAEEEIDYKFISDRNEQFVKLITAFAEVVAHMKGTEEVSE